MLWLDSSYPPEKAGQPGGDRGDCAQDSGVPSDVEASIPDAYVCPLPSNLTPIIIPSLTAPQQGHLVQHPLRTHRLDRHRLDNPLSGRGFAAVYIRLSTMYIALPFVPDCSSSPRVRSRDNKIDRTVVVKIDLFEIRDCAPELVDVLKRSLT